MESQQALVQAECPAPGLCLCPGQGHTVRVHMDVHVWTSACLDT